MKNTKMTQTLALEMAIKGMKELKMNEEAIAILEKMILTKQSQYNKAKAKRQEKSKENDKYVDTLKDMLYNDSMTIAQMKELKGFEDFSTQKITAMLNKIKKEENIVITLVDGKKSYKIEK